MLRTRFNVLHHVLLLIAMLPFLFALLRVPWDREIQTVYKDPRLPETRVVVNPKSTWLWEGAPQTSTPVTLPHRTETIVIRLAWKKWIGQMLGAPLVFIGVYALLTYELRAWRWNRGRCEQCGYDIKSGGQTQCPECGCVRS